MNQAPPAAIHHFARRPPLPVVLSTALVATFTWLIAFVVTLVSLSCSLVFVTVRAITRLSCKCIVYILLATIFVLAIIIGIILSIITLGTISLP